MDTRPWSARIDTDFSEMVEQVGGVFVDAVGSGQREFGRAISAAEQADTERLRPAGAEQVPHALADYDTVGERHAGPSRGGQKHVGLRLGLVDIVVGDGGSLA